MKTALVSCAIVAFLVSHAACNDDDAVFDDDGASTGGELTTAQQTFLDHCKQATDLACDKGFTCDNLFVTNRYNSVAHCQNDVDQDYLDAAHKLSDAQLVDCADTCDVMFSDVQALSCENYDEAVFNTYRCGSS